MPETTFTAKSTSGWPGASRDDLPAYNKTESVKHGDTSTKAVRPPGAVANPKPRDPSVPSPRQLTYQYVEAGKHTVSTANVLWTDSASDCTIVSLWSTGKAGLAHVGGGSFAPRDTQRLLDAFGTVPTEIHLVTMPAFFGQGDGFPVVYATVKKYYAAKYAAIKVYLINGYNTKEWAQKHQLGVDPKSGAYPVFN
jgi:hypothetical protein